VWLPITAVLLVAAAGAVAWIVMQSQSARAEQRPVPAPPFTAERAGSLVADLTSGDPERVRRAVAMPPGRSIEASAVAALARLQVRIDPSTFAASSPWTGTVAASVTHPDGTSAVVVCALLHTENGWLLVDSIPGG
jgi:hypothetical protein